MSTPTPSHVEQRKYPRCQAPVLVRCHVSDDPNVKVQSVSRDISMNGIRFPAIEQLRGGALVHMLLEISAHQAPLQVKGVVSWLREFSRIGRPQYEVGVKFTGISDSDQQRLNAFCQRWYTINRVAPSPD